MGAERAQPLFFPDALSGGIANQIFGLVGATLIANLTNTSLVLPSMRTHVTGGSVVSMSTIFDIGRLVNALMLASIQISILPVTAAWRPIRPTAPLDCYRKYSELSRHNCLSKHTLEDIVFSSLSPTKRVLQVVDDESKRLGVYGCLHARIERDMRSNWHYTDSRAPPPTLAGMLRGIKQEPELASSTRIFVAVGHVASAEDARLLARPTDWGAQLVRRHDDTIKEASFAGTAGNENASYLEAAYADMEICRRAAWFVGWSGSSFTQTVARLRKLDGKDEWFNSCPERTGLMRRRDGGVHNDLCAPSINRSHFKGCQRTPSDDYSVLIARMKRTTVPRDSLMNPGGGGGSSIC